ncbi:MAG: hypothetical protein R6U96_03575 [Promethearchaeia archaeon]
MTYTLRRSLREGIKVVNIILKMDACKDCGECCLRYCKGSHFKDGECNHPDKTKECKMFPIQELDEEYYLRECVGVARKILPITTLEQIIKRLNEGKANFEVKTEHLYCKVQE